MSLHAFSHSQVVGLLFVAGLGYRGSQPLSGHINIAHKIMASVILLGATAVAYTLVMSHQIPSNS
jgi:hypothetical protein